MKATVGKAKLSERELKELPLAEIKRRAARADGKPVPPPTETEVAQSGARQRLEKLKAQRGPVIVPFEWEEELFHIKQLNYQQFLDLGQSVNRNSAGVLNLTPQSQAREVIIATLMACVCNEDGTPYFTYEDVEAYIEEAATAPLVAALYVACNAENESILSTLKKS